MVFPSRGTNCYLKMTNIIIKPTSHLMSSLEMIILLFKAEMCRKGMVGNLIIPIKMIKTMNLEPRLRIKRLAKMARNLHRLTLMVIKMVRRKRKTARERKLEDSS